jgi:hypothetical protein
MFNNPRRAFFKYLLSNLIATIDEMRGRPQHRLIDLDKLPEKQLKNLIPKINSNENIYFSNNGILCSKGKNLSAYRELLILDQYELYVSKCFLGTNTIGEISSWTSKHYGLSQEEGFRITSQTFMRLVKKGVCRPKNDITY